MQRKWVIGMTILALGGVLATIVQCTGSGKQPEHAGSLAVGAATPQVTPQTARRTPQPLDAPGNPYKGSYGLWDEWVYAHLDPDSDGTLDFGRKYGGRWPAEPKFMTLNVVLDDAGYIVPLLQTVADFERLSGEQRTARTSGSYWLTAAGEMEDELREVHNAEVARVRAAAYPPIPTWLAENPPVLALILPNGEVVTSGKLGSGTMPGAEGCACAHGNASPAGTADFYRYDATGKQLDHTHQHWLDMYMQTDPLVRGRRREFGTDGVLRFYGGDNSVVAAYNYDGRKLGKHEVPAENQRYNFAFLNPSYVREFYSANDPVISGGKP